MSTHVSPARIRELFRYEDGQMFWREHKPRRSTGPLGTPAGDPKKRGGQRLQIPVDGRMVYAHRAVWAWHHGEWPNGQVDHINGNPRDNRIENLRVVSPAWNTQNVRHGGVTFERRKVARPWRARIMVRGRSISLGYFDTREEAHAEYERAKLVYHPGYATGLAQVA